MDIKVYDDIINGLRKYNENLSENFGNVIVNYPSANPTYPYTVVSEIRNIADTRYNTRYQKVSSLGYRVDIFAKSKGDISKADIARNLMKYIDDFLTNTVGLTQISYNYSGIENDASIFSIILTYTCNFDENRRRII